MALDCGYLASLGFGGVLGSDWHGAALRWPLTVSPKFPGPLRNRQECGAASKPIPVFMLMLFQISMGKGRFPRHARDGVGYSLCIHLVLRALLCGLVKEGMIRVGS